MNIQFYTHIWILAILFYSCTEKNQSLKSETEIINQIFLDAVDTTAYDYNTLRPYPGLIKLIKRHPEYPITVYDKFINIYEWHDSISSTISQDTIVNLEEYHSLFLNSIKDTLSYTLEVSKLQNTGLYKLHFTNDRTLMKKSGFIGHIRFSRIINNGQIGLMIISIQDNVKSGIEKLLYLKKEKSEWKIIKESIIEIW
jgi:hypothetical protein